MVLYNRDGECWLRGMYWVLTKYKTESFRLKGLIIPYFFPQLYGKCQGLTYKDGTRPALFPHMAASPERLNFTASLNFNFRHGKSGFESQKTFQPKLCPFKRPIASRAMPTSRFNRDGKSLA